MHVGPPDPLGEFDKAFRKLLTRARATDPAERPDMNTIKQGITGGDVKPSIFDIPSISTETLHDVQSIRSDDESDLFLRVCRGTCGGRTVAVKILHSYNAADFEDSRSAEVCGFKYLHPC